MNRSIACALASASLSLVLAACGGGEVDSPLMGKALAPNEGPVGASAGMESGPAGVNATVSEAERFAWQERAALNRAEVEQPVAATDSRATSFKSAAASQSIAKAGITAPAAPIYRFFNNETGAHLFTKTLSERDTVLNTLAQFRYEGPVFSAWNSAAAGLSPVYRFYNTRSGAHFYTISENEKNNLVATAPWMHLDGAAYYASTTAQAGTSPLYRFYHLQKGFHFYTASLTEKNSIVANLAAVYSFEGVGYYVNASTGSFDPALASFAGKVNTAGYINGMGESARFKILRGMAFNPAGNLFAVDISDYGSDPELRMISPAGMVTSFVGNQNSPYNYTDGVGSGATFQGLKAVTFDAAGVGYVGDNRTVRTVTPAGLVTTIAGSFAGTGYINGQAQAARFNAINGIARDSMGNIFVSDTNNNAIRKIATTGVVSTFAGADPTAPSYTRAGYADGVGTAARFYTPGQIAIDASDNLYVADQYNHRVRKISPAGLVTTLAGQATRGVLDGPGTAAKFDKPYALAVNKLTGDVYVADWAGATVRRIKPTGEVTTIVGTAYSPGVYFGSLPAGLDEVGGLAVQGGRLYIASNHGVFWTSLPN